MEFLHSFPSVASPANSTTQNLGAFCSAIQQSTAITHHKIPGNGKTHYYHFSNYGEDRSTYSIVSYQNPHDARVRIKKSWYARIESSSLLHGVKIYISQIFIDCLSNIPDQFQGTTSLINFLALKMARHIFQRYNQTTTTKPNRCNSNLTFTGIN